MPRFSSLISTTHLYSLAPCEKNCMGTLKAHLWPGATMLMLLQSRDASQLSAKKSHSSFVRSRQNVDIKSVNLTEHPVPDCHFSESSVLLCGAPQPQQVSRRVAGGCPFQGRRLKFLFNLLVVPLSCSPLFIHFIYQINDDRHHPLLTPINCSSSSLFIMILCFCFMPLSPLPHLKFSTGFI